MPPTFLTAVFSQPVSSFAKWKERGINALVSHEPEGGRVPKADWEAAAADAGLFFFDYPSDDDATLKIEAAQPFRLGFLQDDEPDLTRDVAADRWNRLIPDGPYKGWTRPELLEARYRRCRAAAPGLPVLVNFAGPQVTPAAYTHGQGHARYIAAADWLAHDWYVKNKNHQRYPTALVAKAMERLAAWSAGAGVPPSSAASTASPLPGKPQLVFIECSDQKISPLGRCPTADEVEQMVRLAVARGARGIVYFPQRPPPGFQFDAMPPEIVARATALNRELAAMASPPQDDPAAPAPDPPPADLLLTRLDDLSGRCAGMSARIDELAAAVAALGERLPDLRAPLQDLAAAIRQLQHSALRACVGLNWPDSGGNFSAPP